MAAGSCLLVVADYPYIRVGDRIFAEIPWDEALASLYGPAFERILLLGRLRTANAAPPGWIPVDDRFYEVLDGGDWETPLGCVTNLPKLWRTLRANWDRVRVIYLKLFYLHSLVTWGFNRLGGRGRRKPVATLLVGDAAEAVLLRDDLVPFAPLRRLAAVVVAATIRFVQARVDLAGFWAQFLADKFAAGRSPTILVVESWLHADQVRRHGREAPRRPATVLFVARLVARKRASNLLAAVGRLVAEGQDLRCVLVGDGPERPALERQAGELGIAERVTFTGWLGLLTPRMLDAYDQADVFCLPSFAEGLPLVIIEAMGRGVAVVATAVSGTPEAVKHEKTGLLVPRDDLEALVGALRRMLTDKDLWKRCIDEGYRLSVTHTFETQRGKLARAIISLAG
jgi:glycosyltransferase involved in cell wall biosynthesis